MIPLPDNQAIIQVTPKGSSSQGAVVEGGVFRTQTGRKPNPDKKSDKKYVDERLVSIRDSDGVEHTFNLDTEVESLIVVKERKDVQAESAAAEPEPLET